MADSNMYKTETYEETKSDCADRVETSTEITLVESIQTCQAAIDKFFNNQFIEAKNMMRPHADKSMYHSLGNSVFLFLEALLTFDSETMEAANTALKQSVHVSDGCRKKTTFTECVGNLLKGPNYDLYSDEEAHAELCHAESLLMRSVLTIMKDESLTSLVKAGIDIRSCFNSYKDCQQILLKKTWRDEHIKIHFESGVRVGIGVFNLMISLLPSKIIKLLEWIGLSGSRQLGLDELNAGCRIDGIRRVLSVMATLGYNLVVLYVFGHTEGDLIQCAGILREQLIEHPESVWFLFFQGILDLVLGNLDASEEWYTKSLESQSVWPQFHQMCYWELFWLHCIKFEWREALIHIGKLIEESNWSKITYGYQKAAVLMMIEDELSSSELKEIETILRDIREYEQKEGATLMPMEQFCIERAERYFTQDKSLVLPALELMLVWNLFRVLKKPNIANKFLEAIEETIAGLESSSKSSVFGNDNKALLFLMRGNCLKYMGKPLRGMACLEEVICLEKYLIKDHYVVPYAIYEVSLIEWKYGDKDKAILALENVRKNFSGYFLEAKLHFRIQSALNEFKNSKTSV